MPVKDTNSMIAGMTPVLTDGQWVYCSVPNMETAGSVLTDAFAIVQEAESVTLILPVDVAVAQGFDASVPMRKITLNVFSDLEGVGLTAAVAHALTACGISCNIVAAYHHDHVFVPDADAAAALDALKDAQKAAQQLSAS
ncbi:ACT domain-containing protein [uncultured Tateyamaria sp.]|nr:ACT domain-containing protein [uncultured Tateyamaria sp.]